MNTQNPFDLFRLPSGLRLMTIPMEHTKTITILVLVGTGSRYETKELNGLSHFLEHLIFKGTEKRPGALDISQELDAIGAEYNAFTSKEYTGYYAKAGAEHLEFVMEIIADIFLNSKLDAREIDKERGVIIQEINMYLDSPQRQVADVYEELLYGDQPLGWTIAGSKENILNLRAEQFRDYFNTHYFAQNTVVAIAGQINREQTKKLTEKFFAAIRQKQEKLKALPVKFSQATPALKLFNKQTDQTHLLLGVRGYDLFDPRQEALKILAVILGGGMSSRLFTEVREKRGLAYYISTSADHYLDAGDLTTAAGVENEKLSLATQVILAEYKKLREEGITEQELKKAKDYVKGKMAISFESSDDLASFYAGQQLLKEEVLTPEEKFAKLNAVTAAEVKKVAQDIFQPQKLNLAFIGPQQAKEADIYNIIKSW